MAAGGPGTHDEDHGHSDPGPAGPRLLGHRLLDAVQQRWDQFLENYRMVGQRQGMVVLVNVIRFIACIRMLSTQV